MLGMGRFPSLRDLAMTISPRMFFRGSAGLQQVHLQGQIESAETDDPVHPDYKDRTGGAVYHGMEPATTATRTARSLSRRRDELLIQPAPPLRGRAYRPVLFHERRLGNSLRPTNSPRPNFRRSRRDVQAVGADGFPRQGR